MQFMCGQVPEKTRKVSSALRRTQRVFSTGPLEPGSVFGDRDDPFLEFADGKLGDRAELHGLVGRGFPPHQIVDDADGAAAADDQAAEDLEGLAAVLGWGLAVPRGKIIAQRAGKPGFVRCLTSPARSTRMPLLQEIGVNS